MREKAENGQQEIENGMSSMPLCGHCSSLLSLCISNSFAIVSIFMVKCFSVVFCFYQTLPPGSFHVQIICLHLGEIHQMNGNVTNLAVATVTTIEFLKLYR